MKQRTRFTRQVLFPRRRASQREASQGGDLQHRGSQSVDSPALQCRSWQLLLLLLCGMLLTACAPGTLTQSEALPSAYVGRPASGTVEPAAVILGEASGRNLRISQDLADAIYSEALVTLRRHPYFRNRYDFVERNRLQRVLEEQGLAASGLIDPASAPSIGNIIGVRKLFVIELTQATAEQQAVGIAGIGGSGYDVNLAMSISIIDSETGRIQAIGRSRDNAFVGSSVVISGFAGAGRNVSESALISRVPDALFRAVNDLAIDDDMN